jgi:hypothetical protein
VYKVKERQRQAGGAVAKSDVEDEETAPESEEQESKEHVQVGDADQERDTMTMRPVGLDKLLRDKDQSPPTAPEVKPETATDEPKKRSNVTKPLSPEELNVGTAAIPDSKRDTRPSGNSSATESSTD